MPQEDRTNPLAKYYIEGKISDSARVNPLEKYKRPPPTEKEELRPLDSALVQEGVSPLEKYKKPTQKVSPLGTTQGRFASGVAQVAKSFLTQFAGVPESIAIAMREQSKITDIAFDPLKDVPIDEYSTYKAGQAIRKAAEDLFPTNPEYQDEFITSKLAGGIGSYGAFIISLLATKGAGMSPLASTALIGGTAVAADEYQIALQKTGDEDIAFASWVRNLPVGATEVIPIGRALKRIDQATGKTLTRMLKRGFVGGFEEGIQEAFQQFASNASAKQLYDAERELMDGVVEGGLVGVILGAGLNSLGSAVKGRIEGQERREGLPLHRDAGWSIQEDAGIITITNPEVEAAGRAEVEAGEEIVVTGLTGTVEENFFVISEAYLPKVLRGKGLGKSLYLEGLRYAKRLGKGFKSSSHPSMDAIRVFASLKKAGIPFRLLGKTYSISPGVLSETDLTVVREEYLPVKELSKKELAEENLKLAKEWAKTQIDENEWIDFFEEKGPSPMDMEHSYGAEIREESVGGRVNREDTDVDVDILYRKPERINRLARKFLFPEFIFKRQYEKGQKAVREGRKTEEEVVGPEPMGVSVDIIRAQLSMVQNERDMESWWKKISHGFKEGDRASTREAMDLFYGIGDPNIPAGIGEAYKGMLKELYTKTPKLQNVIEGVNKRGGLIELFEYVKKRFQNSLREQYLEEMSSEDYGMFSEIVDKGGDPETVVENTMNIIRTAREEFIARKQKKGGVLGTYERASRLWEENAKAREKKIANVLKREVKRITRKVDEFQEISKWGIKDFQTRIELGNYKVTDEEGNTRAWGATAEEAKKKAAVLRNEILQRTGVKPPRWFVDPELSRINPTAKRKGVLKGEVDIFDSLPRYIHAMEKRIVMGPIVKRFKRLKKENPGDFTPDVNQIIQEQINAVMGSRYSWMEKVVDEWATAHGMETGKYRKYIGIARKLEAKLKLGYRPTAALINALSGFGMTYVKVGSQFWAKGRKALKTGKYIDPEGVEIDLTQTVKDIESEGQLGVSLAVQEDGTVSKKIPIYSPLGIFQAPEGPIRRHGFASNYILQRELYNKTHDEAVWLALQGVRFQQSTYNTAAIPEILRSPTGKLIGQFKSFMVNHLQLWSTLSKKEFVRMLEVQMLLAGPRGLIYFLKSLPLIASLGVLNELEKELVAEEGLVGRIGRGLVGGLAGVDLSAPATFQFPHAMEDWLGPALKDIFTLFRDVVAPGAQSVAGHLMGKPENAPDFRLEDGVDWATGLSPLLYYWNELLKSVLIWESVEDIKEGNLKQAAKTLFENAQKPNVWIRDSEGDKAYLVTGVWDRLMLASGAKLSQAAEEQALRSIWNRNMKIRAKNRRGVVGRVIVKVIKGIEISESDKHDLILYGVNVESIPDRLFLAEMTPKERAVMKARILDKAEAIDHFDFDKVRALENQ